MSFRSLCSRRRPPTKPARSSPNTMNGRRITSALSALAAASGMPRARSTYRFVSSAILIRMARSLPLLFVQPVLFRDDGVEFGIFLPRSDETIEVMVDLPLDSGHPCFFQQGLPQDFVEAHLQLSRLAAESLVGLPRHVTDRVLDVPPRARGGHGGTLLLLRSPS